VVDDEAQVGTAIRRILNEHEVISATMAREGLRQIELDPKFDLILCDVAMAEISGQEFFERLGDVSPELRDRVVFMSGGAFTPEIDTF
jgi:DNA-binding NtrC family response regulator